MVRVQFPEGLQCCRLTPVLDTNTWTVGESVDYPTSCPFIPSSLTPVLNGRRVLNFLKKTENKTLTAVTGVSWCLKWQSLFNSSGLTLKTLKKKIIWFSWLFIFLALKILGLIFSIFTLDYPFQLFIFFKDAFSLLDESPNMHKGNDHQLISLA